MENIMIKNNIYTGLLAIVLSTVVACQGFVQSIKDTLNDSTATNSVAVAATDAGGAEVNFLLDSIALQQAEDALRQLPQFAGKTINIYKFIHFYGDGRIMLQLQHPENLEYVDEYQYIRGEWQPPKPVQLSVREQIIADLAPLDDVPFRVAARVTHQLSDKASQIAGAAMPSHTYVIVRAGRITWYPMHIDGDRERYQITFNADGSIQSYERQ